MIGEIDSRFRHLELKIGIFVLIALLGCAAAIVFVGLQSDLFTPKFRLNFTVDKGTGFAKGMPVKLSGFRIGRIESIALNNQAQVDVRLQIDKKYQEWIRQDSVARLVKEGLVGDSIIEIAVGSQSQPMLQDGHRITYEKTKGIEDQVSGIADQVKPVLANVGEIIAYVNDPNGDIKKTLHNVESLTRELQTTRAKADHLIDSSRTNLDGIAHKVDGLLDQTGATLATLNTSLQRLDRTLTTVEQKLPEVLAKVDRTLTHVEKLAADAQQMTGKVAPRVPQLVSSSGSAIEDTGDILRAVKQMWPVRGHLPVEPGPRLIEGDSHE